MKLPFSGSVRDGFHTFRIKLRADDVSYWVDDVCIHAVDANVSHPMTTRLILRTNTNGSMPTVVFEYEYFKFTPAPAEGFGAAPPQGASLNARVNWHNAHPWCGGVTYLRRVHHLAVVSVTNRSLCGLPMHHCAAFTALNDIVTAPSRGTCWCRRTPTRRRLWSWTRRG